MYQQQPQQAQAAAAAAPQADYSAQWQQYFAQQVGSLFPSVHY